MLNDISGVKTWQKVNSGLIKMYKAEVRRAPRATNWAWAGAYKKACSRFTARRMQVLGKLPVMQHMLFGRLFDFWPTSLQGDPEEARRREEAQAHLDHYHDPNNLCCNIRVPSAIASRAAAMAVPMD